MLSRKILTVLLILILSISLASAALAQDGSLRPQPGKLTVESVTSVYPDKDTRTARQGNAQTSFERVSVIVMFDQSFDVKTLEAATGGQIIHRYKEVFNGASLVVPTDKVGSIASLPGVKAVYLDEVRKVDMERTPQFIGAPGAWSQLGGQENAGEGIIVGMLDTGIWPEHPSFSDPDPSGKPYDPPSSGLYACNFGNTAYNPNDSPFTCNNKLIGAYEFLDTYKALVGLEPGEFDSARDSDGHGTHTTSTAAGNGVVAANIFGIDRGVISGVAPRAKIIMYRVCAGPDGSCYVSDSAAAVEQAIYDGVDVINFSIGGGSSPYADPVSLAFLDAYANGIFVAASAGNSGPALDTTDHFEPWTTTVAASNSDRFFISAVQFRASNGDRLTLSGASVTNGISTPTAVVFPPSGEELCGTPLPASTFHGEIVICERGGGIARVAKSFNVAAGGAGGMLLYNPSLQGLATDNHFIPSVHLEYNEGAQLLAFMGSHTGVTATFAPGLATTVKGDVMAAFSSRGGPGNTLGISKPDITAPGVQILAGHTSLPSFVTGGPSGQLFQAIQGTSMSSPVVAGSGAIIKAMHPDWTPGQIKSALMTTAVGKVVKEDGLTPADPFDDGSGRVDLSRAGNPGLTFDESGANYVVYEKELWNANYPSLYIPVMPGTITVYRTVHSELRMGSFWTLSVDSPPDMKVTVPSGLVIGAGAKKTFAINIDGSTLPDGAVRHALLKLKSRSTTLRFPITIVRGQPVVTLEKSCTPASFKRLTTTACTITAQNNSFDTATVNLLDGMPRNLTIVKGSVTGAIESGGKLLSYHGTIAAASPPDVTVVDGSGTSPAGYLPLSLFGTPPFSGVGDETIINLAVPEFVYAGVTYNRIGMVSNGYGVVGGGSSSDIDYINQVFPDPNRPNNVLGPYWTDLNPGVGGALRADILTDGVNDWLILDWENVPEYTDGGANSFQIWIGLNGFEDISFTYGAVDSGDLGYLTVGAENAYGNSGQNWYVNGVGTLVSSGSEVRVVSIPGTPGEIHTIHFTARGMRPGAWTNCASLISDLFQGANVACFSGLVQR
jgi:subtilisin family serine protease